MGELKSKRVGRKPKSHVFNKLTELIKEKGYNVVQTCANLNIAIRNYDDYFRSPKKLSIERLEIISQMTLTPMPELWNIVLNCSKKSKHWFDENSTPVDMDIKRIKQVLQTK